jgi:hypothetical protein
MEADASRAAASALAEIKGLGLLRLFGPAEPARALLGLSLGQVLAQECGLALAPCGLAALSPLGEPRDRLGRRIVSLAFRHDGRIASLAPSGQATRGVPGCRPGKSVGWAGFGAPCRPFVHDPSEQASIAGGPARLPQPLQPLAQLSHFDPPSNRRTGDCIRDLVPAHDLLMAGRWHFGDGCSGADAKPGYLKPILAILFSISGSRAFAAARSWSAWVSSPFLRLMTERR